jgi:hypothetical protein
MVCVLLHRVKCSIARQTRHARIFDSMTLAHSDAVVARITGLTGRAVDREVFLPLDIRVKRCSSRQDGLVIGRRINTLRGMYTLPAKQPSTCATQVWYSLALIRTTSMTQQTVLVPFMRCCWAQGSQSSSICAIWRGCQRVESPLQPRPSRSKAWGRFRCALSPLCDRYKSARYRDGSVWLDRRRGADLKISDGVF